MATMEIFSKDYNVVYVDLASVGGSGVTPADSLNDLPYPDDMVDNTVYLCRRDDTNFHSIAEDRVTTTTFDSIFVLGMPISGDNLYEHTPTEAKLAWGGDTDEYFQFDYTSGWYDWGFYNIKNVGFHRVMFVHHQNGTGSLWGLLLESGTQRGQCFITHCKFIEYKTVNTALSDLSDPLFKTNTSNMPLRTYIQKFSRVLFNDNIINHSLDYDQNRFFASVAIGESDEVICEDNVAYQSSSVGTGARPSIYIYSGASIYFKRNKGYYITQDYPSPVLQGLFHLSAEYIECVDIEVTDLRYYNDISTYTSLSVRDSLSMRSFGDNGVTGGVIIAKNINIHFDHVRKCATSVFTAWGRDYSNLYTPYTETIMSDSVISDINVSYNESITGGIGPADGGNSYTIVIHSLYGKIENISGGNSFGYGMTAEHADYMKNLNIKGKCSFTNIGMVELVNWEYLGTQANYEPQVMENRNSTIYIKNATLGDDWGSGNWILMDDSIHVNQTYVQNRMIFGNVNKTPATTWTRLPGLLSGVWANNVGNPGHWFGENKHYLGEAVAVSRSLSPTTIKLSANSSTDSDIGLWIAPPTFTGLRYTPVSTGTLTLKVYAAFKELDEDELSKKFQVYLDVPTINSGIKTTKKYISTFDGSWADDPTSTWVGDVGLTQKVLSMPFDVELLEAVNVRMKFSWFHATGYMYLDPVVVFE